MKKQYVSPVIEVEQFVLTQAIASCHQSLIVPSQDTNCLLKLESNLEAVTVLQEYAHSGYFWEGFTGCEDWSLNVDSDDGICYHTSMNLLFSST